MSGPHQDQPLMTAGTALDSAEAAVIMIHGRGATAQSILGMAAEFEQSAVAYLAPQAAGNTWYPNSFLQPIESNEPELSSGLEAISDVSKRIRAAEIPTDRLMLLGFSQGACLASEYVARNATTTRYGGLVALSGGLIGPDGTAREYDGSLHGTPVFLGCSDVDPHIPVERVHETAAVLDGMGADVTKQLYKGMGHGINEDELAYVRGMINRLVAADER